MSVTFPAVSNSSIPPASDTHRVDQMRAYWRKVFPFCAESMADALDTFNRIGTHPGKVPVPLNELHAALRELLPRFPTLPEPRVMDWSAFRAGSLIVKT